MRSDALSQSGKAIEGAAERRRWKPRRDEAEPARRSERSDPLRYFVQSAEAAAYPALLFVSLLALAIALSGFFVVVATDEAWAVGLAIVCELLALAMLMAVIYAAMSDADPADDREAATVIPMPQEASSARERPGEGARRRDGRRAA
jgi:hypothetical protein